MNKLPFKPNWGNTPFKRGRMATALYNIRKKRRSEDSETYLTGDSLDSKLLDEDGNFLTG